MKLINTHCKATNVSKEHCRRLLVAISGWLINGTNIKRSRINNKKNKTRRMEMMMTEESPVNGFLWFFLLFFLFLFFFFFIVVFRVVFPFVLVDGQCSSSPSPLGIRLAFIRRITKANDLAARLP